MPRVPIGAVAIAFVLTGSSGAAVAESQRPRAELTPIVDSADVRAGSTARLSLNVRLPKDVHVQADKPRDPSLIPTVLTIDIPPGVGVLRIIYPAPTELAQRGRRDTLAVFGPEFLIEVRVVIASTRAPGDLVIPARLRYQACNATVCFPPATAVTEWRLGLR